jgi:hypothetical protein
MRHFETKSHQAISYAFFYGLAGERQGESGNLEESGEGMDEHWSGSSAMVTEQTLP